MKEVYWSTTKVSYVQQMLKNNDRCTGLDYMEETLSYLALQGYYDIDSAKVFDPLSATYKRRSTCSAHLLGLQTIQDEPITCSVSQHLYHSGETHVCGVRRSIKLTSLRNTSEDFRIRNFEQLFRAQIDDDCRHKVSGFVLGCDSNVLIDSILIKLQNGLVYYRQPFHNTTSVEHLGLDCNI